MTTSIRELITEKWSRVTCHSGGGFMLDLNHQLVWYVAYLGENKKAIIFVSDGVVCLEDETKNVELRCVKRSDDRYNICFILLDTSLEEVFVEMAIDLIEASQHASSKNEAIDCVMARFDKWCRLMCVKHGTPLERQKQQGLFGELLFLKSLLDAGNDPESVLDGWKGAEYGVQDFVYSSKWYEVKTVASDAFDVTISSFEQLDVSVPGELVVVRVSKANADDSEAITLNTLVQACRAKFDVNSRLPWSFMLKLAEAGYVESAVYNDVYYRHINTTHYKVDETFPRIRRRDLSKIISKVQYHLLLDQLNPWNCLEEL